MIERYAHVTSGGEHRVIDLEERNINTGEPCTVAHYAGHEALERASNKAAALNRDFYRNSINKLLEALRICNMALEDIETAKVKGYLQQAREASRIVHTPKFRGQ